VTGVGSDKAQVTLTLAITEAGDALNYQVIFEGTTDRCHPKHLKQAGALWSHSASHWQNAITYTEYVENIVVPYKNKGIADNNLPFNQMTILKHDMHFSHHAAPVVELCRMHNICLLFVPACCTDVLQECDTVLNKTFKSAVRAAFAEHLHGLYDAYLAVVPAQDPALWRAKLTMGALKPFMTGFVECGMKAIRTEAMQATIKRAFAEDGLFQQMRGAECQAVARAELAAGLFVAQPILDDDEAAHHAAQEEEAAAAERGAQQAVRVDSEGNVIDEADREYDETDLDDFTLDEVLAGLELENDM